MVTFKNKIKREREKKESQRFAGEHIENKHQSTSVLI